MRLRATFIAEIQISLLLFFGIILITNHVSATDPSVVDEINLTVPVSCSLSGTGMDTHTTELHNTESDSAIGESTITAYCNDLNGFSIYAVGFTNNEYGNNNLVSVTASTTNTIPTGTNTSGNTSSWAMKLTPITNPTPTYPITIIGSTDDTDKTPTTLDYTSFQPVPNEYALVARRKASTDVGTNAEGSSFKTTYQAYAASGQAAGTYEGQVKYTMVHPYTEAPLQPQTTASGKICYYPNGSNVDGTMGCQTIPESGETDGVSPTSAMLLASNFSRTGYGFAGWSNKFDYATNPNQEGIKFYGPQETITYENGQYVGEGKGLSLYAVWVKSLGSIQDQDKVASVCSSLATAPTDGTANLSSVSAFTDSRDNNTYAIAKLADGKCWMIENLRLEAEDTRTPEKQALAQGYGTSTTYGNFSGLADAESTNFSASTIANSLYYSGTQSGDATVNIGTSNYPGYRMPRYNNLNTPADANNRPQKPTSNTSTDDNTTAGMYSYGNYYTWNAAIADLTHNGTDNQSTANTSLCPTGWRLPQGGNKTRIEDNDDNDFWNLTVDALNGGTAPANYSSNIYPHYTSAPEAGPVADKLRSFPNNFLYSGLFNTSSANSRGSGGYYWSSTANNTFNSYYLLLSRSYVLPGAIINLKHFGYSIRCTVSAGT